jgi:hypothetical protein
MALPRCRGVLTAACVLLSLPLLAQNVDVKTTTLANGMKVLVQEDHSIPTSRSTSFTASDRATSVWGRPGCRTSSST